MSLILLGRGLFGSNALYYRDILHTYWPLHFIAAIGRSHFLHWNPFHNVGLPLVAYVHEGVFYPPNLLFHVLEFPRAYTAHLLLHHFLASLGVYVLCQRMRFARAASFGGALAFSLTGFVVGLVYHGPFLSATAYVPWVGVIVLGRAPLPARSVGIALILAAQVLTGEPQLVIFSALFGFAVASLFARRQEALAVGVAVGLAGWLSAFQLLPTWQLLKETTRSEAHGFLDEWSFHPVRLVETFLPYPFGGYLEVPQFWAWFSVKGPALVPWALSVYLGSAAVALAALGVRRDRRAGFGVLLIAIGLLLAAGVYLPALSWVHTLPPFRFFRYPQKYFLLSALGVAILVAGGLHNISERRLSRRLATSVLAVSMLAIALALVVSSEPRWALAIGRELLDAANTRGDARLALATLGPSLLLGGALAASVAALARLSAPPSCSPTIFSPALYVHLCTAIVGLDLLLAAQRLVWFGPIDFFRTTPAAVAAIKSFMPLQPGRFIRDDEALDRESPHSRTLEQLVERRAWELNTLKSNLGAVFGLEEATGRLPFSLSRYRNFMDALAANPSKRAALLNACVIVTSTSAKVPSGMRTVSTSTALSLAILRNERCLPRLRTVESVLEAQTAAEALRLTAGEDFDYQTAAVVEGLTGASFEPATLESIHWRWDGVDATVNAGSTGTFVILSTVYYPGWTARIDGVEATVRATDGLLVGVQVPSGKHTLRLTFRDRMLQVGASLSGLGLLGAAALLFVAWRSREESTASPTPRPSS